jgi:Na+-transporting methylmalonyl-CoA/oxaloacetate decarboxylase gamma subunit
VDASLVGGLPMTLIGMGTVFAALAALVGVLNLTPRILGLSQKDTPSPLEPPPVRSLERGPAAERIEASTDDLLTVALAAYAYHRRRRASVRPRTASSSWSSAGRSTQLAPFRR